MARAPSCSRPGPAAIRPRRRLTAAASPRLHGARPRGARADLAAVYPPHDTDDDALWSAVADALDTHAPYVLDRLGGPPQTNEVQRTAALCPGFLTVAALTGLPLVTSELGPAPGSTSVRGTTSPTASARAARARPSPSAAAWRAFAGPSPCARPPASPSAPAATSRRATPRAEAGCGSSPTYGPTRPRGWRECPPRSTSPAPTASASRPPTHPPGSPRLPRAPGWRTWSITRRLRTSRRRSGIEASLDAAGGSAPRRRSPGSAWRATAPSPGAAITLTLWPSGETQSARPGRFPRRLGGVDRLELSPTRSRPSRRPPPFRFRHRLHREARVLHQHHLGQPRLGLDRLERHGAGEGRHGADVDALPARVVGGGVGMRLGDHLDHAHHRLDPARMIEKTAVAHPHRQHVVARLEVAHPVPLLARRRPSPPGRPSSRSRLPT